MKTLTFSSCLMIVAFTVFPSVSSAKICARESQGLNSDGDEVVFCQEAFPAAPFVRPPLDDVSNSQGVTLYLAYRAGVFIDRQAKAYVLLDAGLRPLQIPDFPAPLRMPTNRTLFTIYKVRGRITSYQDAQGRSVIGLVAADARPSIVIDGCVIDGLLLGIWEGSVPKRLQSRVGIRQFDPAQRVPIRIGFTKLVQADPLPDWDHQSKLKDGNAYQVKGKIENFSHTVSSTSGESFPNLKDLGRENPFQGAHSAEVSFSRDAGMHAPGDDEIVMTWPDAPGVAYSGMVILNLLSPATLIAEQPLLTNQELSLTAHGTPTGFNMRLRPVSFGSTSPSCH